jgi:hypothetical protein
MTPEQAAGIALALRTLADTVEETPLSDPVEMGVDDVMELLAGWLLAEAWRQGMVEGLRIAKEEPKKALSGRGMGRLVIPVADVDGGQLSLMGGDGA